MLTLLVTGFGPFPGAPFNPSAAIVDGLRGAPVRRLERLGVRLVTAKLPVVFAEIPGALDALLADAKPDVVLHIGLAGQRKKLGVELRARNRLTQLYPDAAGALPASRSVVARGPEFRLSRAPVARLAQALNAQGVATEISRDAGAYVCNETLYLTLGAATPLVCFIHIPRPRGRRPLSRARTLRIPLARMREAIEAVLVMLAREARRQ